jgi:hypothetical protein
VKVVAAAEAVVLDAAVVVGVEAEAVVAVAELEAVNAADVIDLGPVGTIGRHGRRAIFIIVATEFAIATAEMVATAKNTAETSVTGR